jgi:hypothetical protein
MKSLRMEEQKRGSCWLELPAAVGGAEGGADEGGEGGAGEGGAATPAAA